MSVPAFEPTPTRRSAGRAAGFQLPRRLEAHEPPEARGLAPRRRPAARQHRSDGSIVHRRFHACRSSSRPATCSSSTPPPPSRPRSPRSGGRHRARAAALDAEPGRDATRDWIVELRRGDAPFGGGEAGELLTLPAARRRGSSPRSRPAGSGSPGSSCRSRSSASSRARRPIRYGYVPRRWPLSAYQNVYALEPGSAEMASAGRPLTAELLTRLVAAASSSRRSSCTPASRRQRTTSRRTPSASACRSRRRVSSTPFAAGRPRDRGRDDRRARARDGRAARTARSLPGEGWTRPRRHARARRLDRRRAPHRPARAGGLAPRPAARRGRRALIARSYAAAVEQATAGTNSATATSSSAEPARASRSGSYLEWKMRSAASGARASSRLGRLLAGRGDGSSCTD